MELNKVWRTEYLAAMSSMVRSSVFADVRFHSGGPQTENQEPVLISSLLLGAMRGSVSYIMEEENKGSDGFWDIIVPEEIFLDLQNAFLDLASWSLRKKSIVVLEEMSLLKPEFVHVDNKNKVKDELNGDEKSFQDGHMAIESSQAELLQTASIKDMETNEIEYEFPCDTCKELFGSLTQLKQHLRSSHQVHQKYDQPESNKIFVKSRQMMENHSEGTHQYLSLNVQELEKHSSLEKLIKKKRTKLSKDPTTYFCDECGNKFSNSQNLKLHKEAVHENNSVPCPDCGKIFKHTNNLRIHRDQKHSNQSFLCNYCATVFSSRKNLRNHMHNIHKTNAEKKHQCSLCDKAFVEKGKLKAHMSSVHLKDTPYHCRYECGRAYNDASNRNAHEKRNHGSLHLSALALLKERNTLDQTLSSKHYTSATDT